MDELVWRGSARNAFGVADDKIHHDRCFIG
jgi:hypothetical protein